MAVIRSLAVGKSRKSAGDLTYQSYYGKVVAKQKIVANKAYVPSPAQAEQRGKQKYAGKAVHYFMPWIPQSFERSKYGTKVNNFVKSNKDYLYSNSITKETYNHLATYCEAVGSDFQFYFGRGLTNDFKFDTYAPAETLNLHNTIPLVAKSIKANFVWALQLNDMNPTTTVVDLEETEVGSGLWTSGDFKIKDLFGAGTGTHFVFWYLTADNKPLTCLNTGGLFSIKA